MKVKSLLLPALALLSIASPASAQQLIKIPYGTTPTIDGTFSSQEWSDAASLSFSVLGGSSETTVRYKHDSTNLHVAFIGELESSTRFPEILLDIDNSKSAAWQNDDWWFHVSATDCEYQGQYGNYANCQAIRPNWLAANNFTVSQVVDTVEIQIPLSTIQFASSTTDTIGISFLTTNTATVWEYWPATADRNKPSTWANAVFTSEGVTSIKEEPVSRDIHVFPNPNNGSFSIRIDNLKPGAELRLYTLSGKLVANRILSGNRTHLHVSNLPPSIYLLQVHSSDRVYSQKIVVQ